MLKRLLALPPAAFAARLFNAYSRLGVAQAAASLSYFMVLTLFPLLVGLNYVIGLFHLNLEQLLPDLGQFLPQAALTTMGDYLDYAAASQSPALLWASVAALVVCASAALRTLLRTMDELYGTPRARPFHRFLSSVVVALLLLPTVYLSVVVILTGDWFFRLLERILPQAITRLLHLALFSQFWGRRKYLLLFCLVLLLVLGLYRLGIPRGAVSSTGLVLSSGVTALAMVGCSALFSWFLGMSSRYDLIYGSLASIIILLVWLYFCGNILFLGAILCRLWQQRPHT